MKKETIFRHELNESIQANAAMNCLKNRNKPQQLNEFHPAGLARIALPLLKPVVRKIVTNLVSKIGANAITGSRLMHTVMNKLNAGTIAKVAQKIGETWTEVPEELKQEIWDFAVHTFKELLEKENAQPQSPQEQEEEDYGMNDLRKWRDSLDFSNNDDDDADADEETYTAYDDTDGIWMIINIMRKKGMLRAQGIEGRDDVDDGHAIDKAYDLIEKKLNDEGMWIGDDDHEAERFVSFFGEEIAEEAMKFAIHNQEQEELPSMERRDIIFALSEYMSESWIDTGDDGDLDDIYYAIADILDKTGDYPQSTDWKDCKPWCQKHYKEVEARIYNEEEEASCTTKVTVRTPMGMKQMNLSTEVIEAFVRQTGSNEFSDRSAVRVISGIVKEMMKTGYTPTSDEQEIVDIQNAKIKQARAKRDEITDRSMNAFTD